MNRILKIYKYSRQRGRERIKTGNFGKTRGERRENMNKRIYMAGALLTLAAIVAGAALWSAAGAWGNGAAPKRTVNAPASAAMATYAPEVGGYILREHEGRIAVFTPGFDGAPAIVTDIDVRGLRNYDRRLLKAGIRAETYEDVLKLFEDFGS
jgi:hypothetical protein